MIESFALKDAITLLIGGAGLALSIFNFFKAQKKDARQIEVKLGQAMTVVEGDALINSHIEVTATNLGHRPVTVTLFAIEVHKMGTDGGVMALPTELLHFEPAKNDMLPAEITDGKSVSHYISNNRLNHELVLKGYQGKIEITAICEDSASTVYRSKSMDFECGMYQKSKLAL
jgi:hypothetical protein